jgi:tRNA (guanine37-N1)-methyltransferase
MLTAKIITILPQAFPGTLGLSLIGRALQEGIWNLEIINLRDYATDKHGTVDDTSFGGGNGMIMRPDILGTAIEANSTETTRIIYLSPRGKLLKQPLSNELANETDLLLICGRFEGIDERLIEYYNIEEISIGDYVLAGGEVAAMVLLESVIRLKNGTLENEGTIQEESFGQSPEYQNLLEYPQYTRPQDLKNLKIPEILLSGNHQKIAEWRLNKAKELTRTRRPELLD